MSIPTTIIAGGATAWRSDRLIFRAVEIEDEAFLNQFYADPESYLNANSSIAVPRGKKAGVEWREHLQHKCLLGVIICLQPKESASRTSGTALSETDTLTPIGTFSLSGSEVEKVHHRCAMIGINLLRKYHGQGFGSEAILWGLRWGFCFGNLHRIEIGAVGYNSRASNLYARLGFVPEGRKREAIFFDGEYWDIVDLAMLRTEWIEKYGKQTRLATSGVERV